MARTSKSSKRKQLQKAKSVTAPKPARTRRDLLAWGGFALLGTAAFAGGGAWAVSSFNQSVAEHDLTRIGQGRPAIVQIHDPQCPMCTALQRETRKALAKMTEAERPVYLIADLTRTEGAVFAQLHSVPHVTLLIFDAQGRRVETLTGTRTQAELLPVFERFGS